LRAVSSMHSKELARLPSARELWRVEHDGLSAAVLDFGLRDGDTEVVCGRLTEREIPFVLYSGYRHTSEACRGGTVVPEPAPPAMLITAIAELLCNRDPS
jgi:hypothetical protein